MGDVRPALHVPSARGNLHPVDAAIRYAEIARAGETQRARMAVDHLQHAAVREYQHLLAGVTLQDRPHRAQGALVEDPQAFARLEVVVRVLALEAGVMLRIARAHLRVEQPLEDSV